MFLLDTNVVSELRRPHRTNAKVAAWADSVSPSDMFLSSVTILELETGALLLGRRDQVDTAVARRCAHLHVPNPKPYRDSLIAATALVHHLIVVTRNRTDFEPMAVTVLNPWE